MSEIAAILLGAGRSTRFGADNKLLADVDGLPLAARVASVVAKAMPDAQRVLVIGPDGEGVHNACAAYITDVATNDAPDRGLSSSIETGLSALDAGNEQATGVLVTQLDMPGLSAGLISRLCSVFISEGSQKIVFPVDGDGRQRTPVIWPIAYWDQLARLSGDTGGKDIIAHADALHQTVRVDLEASEADAIHDIDTQEQLARWRDRDATP